MAPLRLTGSAPPYVDPASDLRLHYDEQGEGRLVVFYREALTRFPAQQDRDEAAAPRLEPVARRVVRILDTENPRLRSSVGMLGQRIVVPLKRFAAQRLLEQMLIQALGL